MTEPTRTDPSLPPRRLRFIDGVYNHCDRWCERCRFQDRCRVYRDIQRHQAKLAGLPFPTKEEDEAMEEPDPNPVSESQRREWLAILGEANDAALAAEADVESHAAEARRQHDAVREHELSRAGEDFKDMACGLTGALRARLGDSDDAVVLAALETVDRLAFSVQGHLWRTAHALVERLAPGPMVPDDDGDVAVGNGSAKVVRLMLSESREAWQVLRGSAVVAADGVPAAMIRQVETLDELVMRYFPDAMSFVRAGFDEPEYDED